MSARGHHGGVPVVAIQGSLVRRMLVTVLLVVALVGMHHLVASDCALHVDSHQVAHVADGDRQAAPAPPHVSDAHSVVDFNWVQPPAGSGNGTDLPTVMTCVAILLLLVLLVRPRSWMSQRSWWDARRSQRQPGLISVVRAPDLHQLSISRT